MKKLLLLLLCVPLMFSCGEKEVDIDKLWEYTMADCTEDEYGIPNQCISGDCEDGYGIYLNLNHYAPGSSIQETGKGTIYQGEFSKGKRHGKGTYLFREGPFSGSIYEGEFRENLYNGHGTFTFSVPSPKWKINYDNPNETGGADFNLFRLFHQFDSKGNVINHYLGFHIIGDGDKYVGEFQNGLFHGKGTYTYDNGDEYVGEWFRGQRTGQGTYTYDNVQTIDTTFANGDKYVGEYKDNKMHGKGTMSYGNGRVEKGLWENGQFIGE